MMKKISLPDGYDYDGPFIKQVNHSRFNYTPEYKSRQSTNIEMAYLRLGWLAANIPYETMSKMKLVDVGSGNGVFVSCAKSIFKQSYGYDLCGPSITEKDLMSIDWDLIVLSDVFEHFEDIQDLFSISWEYAMLSFPETPNVKSFEELKGWRHFKPDEHIYHLNLQGMKEWLVNKDPGIEILASDHFEDHIRRRWDESVPNITTMLVRRKQ